MSNHEGSYMLNRVLFLLKNEYIFFENMTLKERFQFIRKIIKIGYQHDCNPGEIMEELGKELGYCYRC